MLDNNLNLLKKILLNLFSISFIGALLLLMVSGRSFSGLIIFNLRVGEYLVGLGLLLALTFLLVPRKFLKNYVIETKSTLVLRIIVLLFVVVSFITEASYVNPYLYRSSSFIWTIFITYLGAILLKKNSFEKYYLIFFLPVPFINYLFATGYYPNFIIDFYNKYSDKFQFIKASDLLLTLIVCNLVFFHQRGFSKSSSYYIYGSTAIYLPLLLFNSRGAFISAMLFLLLVSLSQKEYFSKNKIQIIIVTLIVLSFGILSLLYIGYSFEVVNIEPEIQVISEAAEAVTKQKNTVRAIFGFYICENRLCSVDNTLDWRLDIWGDLFKDMNEENILFKGYGFNEIFPIMLDPTAPGRLGRDGLNENVHNYFFNILGRTGFVGLLVVLLFYFYFIREYIATSNNLHILIYLIPVFFSSFFDATMEGVQFPVIFFSFLGYLYLQNQYLENDSFENKNSLE